MCISACSRVFMCMHVRMCTIWMLVPLEAELCQIPVTGVTDGFESDVDAVTAEPPFQPLIVQVLITLFCSHPQMSPSALHLSQSSPCSSYQMN